MLLLTQLFLICALAYLAYVDLRIFRLPDLITIPLLFMGITFNYLSNLAFATPIAAIAGACLGYFFLWGLNFLYRLRKKQNGIGMGDAKLLAALGAWFGWMAIPQILFIASVCGLIGGAAWLTWNKQNHRQAFPFGPFLSIAGIIQLLCPQILQSLLQTSLI
jgi:leader peptidase (prepilin peptidase) / N-methyltransferase